MEVLLQQPGHLETLRHELRTCLNHIIGYGDILVTDAKEYDQERFIPALQGILKKAEKIRKLISFFFGDDTDLLEIATPNDIRKAFYVPLVQMIGDSRRLLVTFKTQEPIFVRDMEQLISVSNQMLDIVEAEIVELELESVQIQEMAHEGPLDSLVQNQAIEQKLQEKLDESVKEDNQPSLLGIPDFKEFEAELGDGLSGIRARVPAHILIVDDSVSVQMLLSRNLSALGHVTYTVDSGQDALDFVAREFIDIIILDVLMPGMTGYQVLRELKKNPELKNIPVIMISSLNSSENIAQCIKLGAEDYLSKDFEPAILRARIDACMEKRQLQKQQDVYLNAVIESQKALARELSDAANYISNLLPKPIKHDAIETGILFIPSAQLGGDFAGHHWLDHETLALYVIDVSGHGVKSALLSVSLFNTLSTQALPGANFYDPGDVLTQLNINFQQSIETNTYFTLWYGIYNLRTRLLKFANGGSPPGVLINPEQSVDQSNDGFDKNSTDPSTSKSPPKHLDELNTHDMLLGALDDCVYQTHARTLIPGSNLYIFSDGIFEILRPNGKILGLKEFQRLLEIQQSSAQDNLDEILNQVRALSMTEAFEDDISLISMKVLG